MNDSVSAAPVSPSSLSSAAVAIMCLPCRRRGPYFAPTDEWVLADLDGNDGRHPLYGLAARLCEPSTVAQLRHTGVTEVVVLVDDLAVTRSWMLPPDPPDLTVLWQRLRATAESVLHHVGLPTRITRLSDLLRQRGETAMFTDLVASHITAYRCAVEDRGGDLQRRMTGEIRRRHRFARIRNAPLDRAETRDLAAAQLANYSAQGVLMRHWRIATYLPWTTTETNLMSAIDTTFPSLVAPWTYAPTAVATGTDALAGIPRERADLRATLALYLRDLPDTPGTVVPGLIADATAAIGAMVTPGMTHTGLRHITALNRVLPGEQINRGRVAAFTKQLTDVPADDLDDHTLTQLWCQLVSRYTDDANRTEYARRHRIIGNLLQRLPTHTQTALVLTGSTTRAPNGRWHPFLSDIDVMPLHTHPPSPPERRVLDAVYAGTATPVWLYLNTGARAGVGGLTRDPAVSLFAADQLTTLTRDEFAYLRRAMTIAQYVGGNPETYRAFTTAFQAAVHRHEPAGAGERL